MSLAAWALLTLAEAKDELAVGNETVEDAAIESLIEASTIELELAADRKIVSRAYAGEVFDGTGMPSLELRQFPVTAVSSVEFWNGSSWETQDLTDLAIVGARATRITLRGTFPRGFQNVRVSYTAGLAVDANLKAKCKEILMLLYKRRDRQLAGIASQSFPGGQTITYRNDEAEARARALMVPYARNVY